MSKTRARVTPQSSERVVYAGELRRAGLIGKADINATGSAAFSILHGIAAITLSSAVVAETLQQAVGASIPHFQERLSPTRRPECTAQLQVAGEIIFTARAVAFAMKASRSRRLCIANEPFFPTFRLADCDFASVLIVVIACCALRQHYRFLSISNTPEISFGANGFSITGQAVRARKRPAEGPSVSPVRKPMRRASSGRCVESQS